MKRLFAILLIIAFALLTACGSDDTLDAPLDVLDVPPSGVIIGATPTPQININAKASLSVGATAAYIFSGLEGTTLYGAVEFTNTGETPLRVTNARFMFDVKGTQVAHEFAPVFCDYGAILPGETSYVTLWLPRANLTTVGDITLTAELTPTVCENSRVDMGLSNLYLADNYPGVTTLSGRLHCIGEGCAINIAYVGFYDANEKFLGAWHFTKNARLEKGDQKNFVVNMDGLPIPNLAETTVSMKSLAYGFEY